MSKSNAVPLNPEAMYIQALCFHFSGKYLASHQEREVIIYAEHTKEKVTLTNAGGEETTAGGILLPGPKTTLIASVKYDNPISTYVPSFIPCTIVLALAAEIYLKSLLVINTPTYKPDDHHLKTMYDNLKPEQCERLRVLFISMYGNDRILKFKNNLNKTLDDHVEYASNTFVKWRYAYEFPKLGNSPFMEHICGVLGRYFQEIKPDWSRKYGDNLERLATSPSH
jgi:hypothetical protein